MTFDWNETAVARLRVLWIDGLPTKEIGKILGCGKCAAIGKAHRIRLPARPHAIRPSAVCTEEIACFRQMGWTQKAIAIRLGLARQTVTARLTQWFGDSTLPRVTGSTLPPLPSDLRHAS